MKYFLIQFWGECHGVKDEEQLESLLEENKDENGNIKHSKHCFNTGYQRCINHGNNSPACVGNDKAGYIYLVSKGGEKSNDGESECITFFLRVDSGVSYCFLENTSYQIDFVALKMILAALRVPWRKNK